MNNKKVNFYLRSFYQFLSLRVCLSLLNLIFSFDSLASAPKVFPGAFDANGTQALFLPAEDLHQMPKDGRRKLLKNEGYRSF